jgi:uncharacterized repeat protein (TIGR02543 family)
LTFDVSFTVSPAATPTYTVTVNGSNAGTSGTGSYTAGTTVTISAGSRSNYSFDGWTVASGGAVLANANSATTTFAMPANAVTVTAGWTYTGGNNNGNNTTPTQPPTTPPDNGKTTDIGGGSTVDTPKGQDPIDNGDGSITLPGGGTVKTDDGVIITVPENTIINSNGDIIIPNGGTATLEIADGIKIELSGGSSITDSGNSIIVGNSGGTITHDNGHTFNIPEDAVIILDEDTPLGYYIDFDNLFVDITDSDWYYDSVIFAYTHGLMTGTNANPMMFSPNMPMTRGMIVTVLYRMAGSPDVSSLQNPFGDVASDKYYAAAVIWAAANGIVSGYGSNKYGPDDNVTREQLAAILYNYLKYTELRLPKVMDYSIFNDDADCADYAKEAIEVFFEAGIINGKPGNLFDPKGNATRAEFAAMLMRFLEVIEQGK